MAELLPLPDCMHVDACRLSMQSRLLASPIAQPGESEGYAISDDDGLTGITTANAIGASISRDDFADSLLLKRPPSTCRPDSMAPSQDPRP